MTEIGGFYNYLFASPFASPFSEETVASIQQSQTRVAGYLYAVGEGLEKTRELAKELAEFLGISVKVDDKDFFADLRFILETAKTEILAHRKSVAETQRQEIPATEKPKFDNRPAGSRWR